MSPLISAIADDESGDFGNEVDSWLETERARRFVDGHPFRLEAMYQLAWLPKNAKTVAEACDTIACIIDLLSCDMPLADNIDVRSAVSSLFGAEINARLKAIADEAEPTNAA